MLIFNWPGLIITGIAFAIGIGVASMLGSSAEGPAMLIAGPLIVVGDLAFRLKTSRNLLRPRAGGSLFFLPAWILGILWFVLGSVYATRGQ